MQGNKESKEFKAYLGTSLVFLVPKPSTHCSGAGASFDLGIFGHSYIDRTKKHRSAKHSSGTKPGDAAFNHCYVCSLFYMGGFHHASDLMQWNLHSFRSALALALPSAPRFLK